MKQHRITNISCKYFNSLWEHGMRSSNATPLRARVHKINKNIVQVAVDHNGDACMSAKWGRSCSRRQETMR